MTTTENVSDGFMVWTAGTPAQRSLAVKWIKRRRETRSGVDAVWAAAESLAHMAARRLSDGLVAEATDFAVAWRLCQRIAAGISSTAPIVNGR